jgi:hypothetical protein
MMCALTWLAGWLAAWRDAPASLKYLPKLLDGECKKIIHQNRSLGINMQELKLEENYSH